MVLYLLTVLFFAYALCAGQHNNEPFDDVGEAVSTREIAIYRPHSLITVTGAKKRSKLNTKHFSISPAFDEWRHRRERGCLWYTHSRLVLPSMLWSLREYTDYVSTPAFYALVGGRGFLNIYIFPSLHTMPFLGLPSYLRWTLLTLAAQPRTTLLTELGDTDVSEKRTLEIYDRLRAHPDFFLNRETLLREQAEYLAQFRSPPFVCHEERQKFIEYCIENPSDLYANWFLLLSHKSRVRLIEGLKDMGDGVIEALQRGDINPVLLAAIYEHSTPEASRLVFEELDTTIAHFFRGNGHKVIGMETPQTRADAMLDDFMQKRFNQSDLWQIDIEALDNNLQTLAMHEESLDCHNPMPLRMRSLTDIASSPMVKFWREGEPCSQYIPEVYTVNQRNMQWWDDFVAPLLERRLSGRDDFAPILLMYGTGHNVGGAGIIPRLMETFGLKVMALRRKGWVEAAIKDFASSG